MAARRAHPRNTSLLDSRLQRSSGTHGVHWGISGEPSGYGSRTLGAFLLPVVVLGMWGLLIALPRLHPRSENIEKFRDTYDVFVVAVIAVMCVLHVAVVGSALGWPVPVSRLAPVAIWRAFHISGNPAPAVPFELLLRHSDALDPQQRYRMGANPTCRRLSDGADWPPADARGLPGLPVVALDSHRRCGRPGGGGPGLLIRRLAG